MNTNNFLLVIDIEKNYNFYEENNDFVLLNRGLINLKNFKKIFLKDFIKERKKIYEKLVKKISSSVVQKSHLDLPLIEFEINNLRNDRYSFIDRIINFIILKKIIFKKKIKKIKIISDNPNTFYILNNLNIEIEKIKIPKQKKNIVFLRLRLIKFYLKTFFVVLFLLIRKKNKIKKKKEFFFCIFLNKFNYSKKNSNKKTYLNFLQTDETHLNFNFFKILKNIDSLEDTNVLHIESFISLKYIIFLISKTIFMSNDLSFLKKNFNFEGLDFSEEINYLYTASFLNRSKLLIYDHAITKFLKVFNIQKIHLYMFEYSFGFYLINKIRRFSPKIEIVGYQHGIFTNNLCWFDILRSIRDKKNYLPNKIFATNTYSFNDYKEKLGKIKIYLKERSSLSEKNILSQIKIKKESKNMIVFCGTHDIADLYYFFKNTECFRNKNIFFKLHPKNRFNFKKTRNIFKISNIKSKNFSNIIISQTSSLIYNFLKMKKKISVIDLDYKDNLLNSKLLKKINLISKKRSYDRKITLKI